MKIIDDNGLELDFYAEISKHAGYLRQSAFARQLALYELYKRTVSLPGSVAEFGVWRGATFFWLARLIETFNGAQYEPTQMSQRHLYGFECFQGFSEISEEDETETLHSERKVGGLATDREQFFSILGKFSNDSRISDRLHIVEGDVSETFSKFIDESPGVRFSFVLLDMDVFKPTQAVLERILEVMVPNGLIIFDEYGQPEWPGETQAVDNFIRQHSLSLESIPWAFAPSAFCVVGAGTLANVSAQKHHKGKR
jgi:3-O-methyltransferase